MKIHGLPGKSPRTEPWLRDLLDSLELRETAVTVQRYECWQSPGSELDLDLELSVAGRERPDLIVGKSIGALIAIYGHRSCAVRAGAYVLIGTPVRGRPEEERLALNDLCGSTPVLLIQKTHDPAGSFSELREMVSNDRNATFVEMPGDDHRYEDLDALKHSIEAWHGSLGG